MVKYIVTRGLEVDEMVYESEEMGVFDTEAEARQMAESILDEMPEHEKLFYELEIWKASGDAIDTDDWDTFDDCHTVEIYPAKMSWDGEEPAEELITDLYDSERTVHVCRSPMQDSIRIWIGEDPSKYVDRVSGETAFDLAAAVEDWYKCYGRFVEEDWRECFPGRCRDMYLDSITRQGYSNEEAAEILRYLPLTDSDLVRDDVRKMIELYEEGVKTIEPYRMPEWKKMVLAEQEDLWTETVRSPKEAQAVPELKVQEK